MAYEALRQRFAIYTSVHRPERDEADWWAGAPSVAQVPGGDTYMACRMREAISPRGKRGYEVRLLASGNGVEFDIVGQIKREDVPIRGFERPSLLYDGIREKFRLYLCGPWPYDGEGRWSILRLDDVDDPGDFDPKTARPVLCPETPSGERDYGVKGYKDPFIWAHGDEYRMVVIGQNPERAYQFSSKDGDVWQRVGDGPWFDLSGWHSFYTRPACVLPVGAGWLVVYEGSHPEWFDPPYNIATGLAWTPDLVSLVDLTPDEPLLRSTTPGRYHTWRYSHWVWRGEEIWVYAEVSCPNDTNEIRLFRLALA